MEGVIGAWGGNHTQNEEASRSALKSRLWWQSGCCIGDSGMLRTDVTHWNPDVGSCSDFSIVFLSNVKCGPFPLRQRRRNVWSTLATVHNILDYTVEYCLQ